MTIETIGSTPAIDLTALLDATTEPKAVAGLPKAVRAALTALPRVAGTVRVPDAEHPWGPADVQAAERAMDAARTLQNYAKSLADTVTEAALAHVDLLAEARAAADPAFALDGLPRNSRGHLVFGEPVRIPVPGTDRVLSVEYRHGAPNLAPEDLLALRRAGKISRKEYRRMTRTVTVVDPAALKAATGRDPGLADRLRGAWKAATPSISVHLRTKTS